MNKHNIPKRSQKRSYNLFIKKIFKDMKYLLILLITNLY